MHPYCRATRLLTVVFVLLLGGFVVPLPAWPDQKDVDRLVQQLGSDRYAEREAASKALEEIGDSALPALREARRSQDVEVRRRAAWVEEAIIDRRREVLARADLAALQGFWVLKRTEYMGEGDDAQDPIEDELEKFRRARLEITELQEIEEDLTEQRTTLEIKGSAFDSRSYEWSCGWGHVASITGRIVLDVSRQPRVLERWVEDRSENPARLRVSYYTYRVQGDNLQIGLRLSDDNDPNKLPTRFTTDNDEEVVILTYKREKNRFAPLALCGRA